MPKVGKFDEDGNEIETTDEEKAEAVEALKGIFNGQKELVILPEAMEQLEAMGMTLDDLLAMMAKDLGVSN